MNNAFSGPGLSCPQCGAPITVTIEKLVATQAIACANCGFQLQIDLEQSRETLNAVRDLQERLTRARRSEG